MTEPRAVLTRPAARPDAVVRYGDHPEQLLDLHLPAAPGRAPVVALVHGGFWRQEYDRIHTRPLAQALAAEGWAVVSPEYRRTGGDGGWPMTFDDVATATEYVPLLEEVAPGRLQLDTLTVLGHSAGGHLALWLGRCSNRPAAPPVRRVVALAPVADLREAYARDLGDGAVAALMGGSPQERPAQYAAADPTEPSATEQDDVDVVVLHGDLDEQVPVAMSRALSGVRYVELTGVEHFGLIDPASPAWPHVLAAVEGSSGPEA